MKVCCKCRIEKPFSEFAKNKTKKDGYHSCCKECKATYYKENPETHRARSRRLSFLRERGRERNVSSYNITQDEYYALLAQQDKKCAICGKTEKDNKKALAIDHCHTTDKVRGLLCTSCNTSLGKFKDSVELLQNAITYLLNPPFNKDKDTE